MAFTNNVMIVRHKLLADLVRLWKKDELTDKIDRLPIELSPRKSKPLGRCCSTKSALYGNTNASPCWDWTWQMKRMS